MDINDVSSMSPAQQQRRTRMLAAASRLATEGGYEAVSMRAVAKLSGTSLATVYRHFTSKDGLLLALFSVDLYTYMRGPVLDPYPLPGPERLKSLSREVTTRLLERPKWTAAVLQAWTAGAEDLERRRSEMAAEARRRMLIALGVNVDVNPDSDTALAARVLNQVWLASMVTQTNRAQPSANEVMKSISFAVDRFFGEACPTD